MVKSLTGRRSSGKAPAAVDLPKEQKEELERRQKACERAERLAKAGPRRAAPVASTLPVITPIFLHFIQHPEPKQLFTLVAVEAVNNVREGQVRAEVLAALGKPSSIAAVNGLEDGSREVLAYHVTPQRTFAIRFHSGLVTAVTRNWRRERCCRAATDSAEPRPILPSHDRQGSPPPDIGIKIRPLPK